jgi:hypothetical protein
MNEEGGIVKVLHVDEGRIKVRPLDGPIGFEGLSYSIGPSDFLIRFSRVDQDIIPAAEQWPPHKRCPFCGEAACADGVPGLIYVRCRGRNVKTAVHGHIDAAWAAWDRRATTPDTSAKDGEFYRAYAMRLEGQLEHMTKHTDAIIRALQDDLRILREQWEG